MWSFDLGNHHHVGANQFAHLFNILRLLNKRKRNHFNRLRPGNGNVAAVFGREQVVGYFGIGHVHALARFQFAALNNSHFNRVAPNFFNYHFQSAVVQQHPMPYFNPLFSRISGGAQTNVGKRKGNQCATVQHLFRADVSVFRALNVNKNCNAWRGASNAVN